MDRPERLNRVEPGAALQGRLQRIDGRGYKAYRDAEGAYEVAPGIRFVLDRAQADPFAAPSRCRVQIDRPRATLPLELSSNRVRAVALADALVLAFLRASAPSTAIHLAPVGAEVLERSSVCLDDDQIEWRLRVSLPARGRSILGRAAARILLEELPARVQQAIDPDPDRFRRLREQVDVVEDQHALRQQLEEHGLVAFLADGAVLPRASGVSSAPLQASGVRPLRAPASLRTRLIAPHQGPITGMGVPRGVTLICGGAFHGKSTLLDAIARGVYDHRPGDGRERCVTVGDAMKVRAETGRCVHAVDIRPFLGPLPGGERTESFHTQNASGSTSQAASIVEALEAGATLILLDEDTSAGNLLAQDQAMRDLLRSGQEPIIHLTRRARQLHHERGVSCVLALGGSGEAFAVADRVLQLVEYEPQDVTARAREIARARGLDSQVPGPWPVSPPRRLDPASLDPSRGRRSVYLKVRGEAGLELGRHGVDLRALEQLVDVAQIRALGWLIAFVARRGGEVSVSSLLEDLENRMEAEGLSVWAGQPVGDLARPRCQELAGALNRLREARFAVAPGGS